MSKFSFNNHPDEPYLLIHPEALPTVVALAKSQPEEVLPEDRVPGLPDQLVVNVQAEGGEVPPDGGHLLVGQVGSVLLLAGQDLLQLHPRHGPGPLVLRAGLPLAPSLVEARANHLLHILIVPINFDCEIVSQELDSSVPVLLVVDRPRFGFN